jgi:membrane protease YdiL (CAAX protease family)
VFFPGLAFGWMRARTGSLAAGTAFHASCNLLSEILHASFFG